MKRKRDDSVVALDSDEWKEKINNISDDKSGTWVVFVFPDYSILEARIDVTKLSPSFWNFNKHVETTKTKLPYEFSNLFDIDTEISKDENNKCSYHMLHFCEPVDAYTNVFAVKILIEMCRLDYPPRLSEYANDLDENLRTDEQKDVFIFDHVLKFIPKGPVIIGKCKHIMNDFPQKLDLRLREFLEIKTRFFTCKLFNKLIQFKNEKLSHVTNEYEMARHFSYCEPFLIDDNICYNLFFKIHKIIYGDNDKSYRGYLYERDAVFSSLVALVLIFHIPPQIFQNCKFTFRNSNNKLINF